MISLERNVLINFFFLEKTSKHIHVVALSAMANFTGTSGSEEFAGDEFSNNLFSDLAPLLTLFGEQVTKQFLSMR